MDESDDAPRYAFTPETLGAHWQVSAATVRSLVRWKELRSFRVGRQIRIRMEDALAYEQADTLNPKPREE